MNLANFKTDIFNLDHLQTMLMTLVIVLIYFAINRVITGYRTGRQPTEELAVRDNFAYGLSYAGSIFAFVWIASEVFSGINYDDPVELVGKIIVYGILTIGCVEIGRYIHDRFILVSFDENKAINQRSITAALIDAASLISNAIAVIAIVRWSGEHSLAQLPTIIVLYGIFQLQLLGLTRWREYRFANDNQGDSMQRIMSFETISLSIKHAGYLIAAALAVKTATQVGLHLPQNHISNIINLTIISSAVMVLTIILAALSSKIVLRGINAESEIDHQDNVGIATIELSILVAIAMMFVSISAR